jgi:hypothetical protein
MKPYVFSFVIAFAVAGVIGAFGLGVSGAVSAFAEHHQLGAALGVIAALFTLAVVTGPVAYGLPGALAAAVSVAFTRLHGAHSALMRVTGSAVGAFVIFYGYSHLVRVHYADQAPFLAAIGFATASLLTPRPFRNATAHTP